MIFLKTVLYKSDFLNLNKRIIKQNLYRLKLYKLKKYIAIVKKFACPWKEPQRGALTPITALVLFTVGHKAVFKATISIDQEIRAHRKQQSRLLLWHTLDKPEMFGKNKTRCVAVWAGNCKSIALNLIVNFQTKYVRIM